MTQPKREIYAKRHCDRQGFSTFLPLIEVSMSKVAALFPGYIFVKIDQTTPWLTLNNTYGVQRVVTFGEYPSKVDPKFIRDMRVAMGKNGAIERVVTNLTKGDSVLVKVGVMRDHYGIYQGMTARQRLRVLFNLLGRTVEIEVKASQVEAVAA